MIAEKSHNDWERRVKLRTGFKKYTPSQTPAYLRTPTKPAKVATPKEKRRANKLPSLLGQHQALLAKAEGLRGVHLDQFIQKASDQFEAFMERAGVSPD